MPMKLYADPGHYKTWKTLIAANYNRLNVEAPKGGGSSTGKIPVLETDNGCIFSSNAIARYISRMRADIGLYGQNFLENGMVDSWMEFCTHELEVPLCTWTYPIKGIFENVPEATKQAKEDVKRALDILNKHLLVNTYMVGHQMTLADICVACALVDGYKLVFDENGFRKPYANLLRWFELCINQPEFQSVIGKVTYCGAGGGQQQGKGKENAGGGASPKAKAEPKAKADAKAKAEPKAKADAKAKAKAEAKPTKAEPTPEELKKQKLKKVIKEGGKRGVEIEGAADMGGLGFFCTSVDEPDGDVEMLLECLKAMNVECDPSEEERKGGAGKIGKMLFSAGLDQLAFCAHVPASKASDISCKEWITKVCSEIGGKVLSTSTEVCTACVKQDKEKGIFPLKVKDTGITAAITYLKGKGLFPDKDDDSDDEYVFGDDDMPGM